MSDLPDGTTPLDDDEADDLLPAGVTTRGELNAQEQANILDAERWLLTARPADVLATDFVLVLHRRMFGRTWRWAGRFRTSEKNIGVPRHLIAVRLRELLDDVRHQVTLGTWPLPEIAARYHHRLVQVHCFANGNGRHARLCADVLLEHHGAARLSWGGSALDRDGAHRRRYIAALQAADGHDYEPLLKFLNIAT